MQVQELAPGLWRWTAPHPAWRPGADWPPEVGCVYYEAREAVVLIDPLVPPADDGERFWRALDRDVERAGRPVLVLLTAPWHARSADAIVDRYGGRIGTAAELAGVEAYPVPPVAEGQVALFVRERGALVTAEVLAGSPHGLRVCPSPALGDSRELDGFLGALLDLPVELVLVAHGEPVLERAHEQLERLLAA